MIKITLIAPYKELIDLAKTTLKENNEYENSKGIQSSYDNYELEGIISNGYDVDKLSLDSDVIISRGITADILKCRQNTIPIVEIPVAGNDLTRCLYKSLKLYGNKRVGVIGSKNMIFGAEDMSEIVGVDVRPYVLDKYEDIRKLVYTARSEGCEVIISGVTSCKYAEEIGMHHLLLETGKKSMWQAITEAKRAAHISQVEQRKNRIFQSVLNYAYEGVVAIDKENIITVVNSSAQKTLGINDTNLIGKRIDDVIPDLRLVELIKKDDEVFDQIVKYKNLQLTLNKVSIFIRNENVGNLIIFQDITRVQELEGKIRNKVFAQGHIARHSFSDIIGDSRRIRETIEFARKVSQVDSNVIILGGTGTGKELFAQSIHNASKRSSGPFVAVNCAALPENLLESELFGYVEGAFTGAAKGGKAGLFELAHMGTIFLDEIGEMSPKLQSRLLRVIQEKKVMRIGDDRVISVNIRIISASNKDLGQLVDKGLFREDLYYRLDVLNIKLPSLRERREDILLLADAFVKEYGIAFDRKEIHLTDKAKIMLSNLEYKGNIRQLRNICERLVVLCQSDKIDYSDIETILSLKGNSLQTDMKVNDEMHAAAAERNKASLHEEKSIIEDALRKAKYNKILTAKILGISRSSLYRLIRELGIE